MHREDKEQPPNDVALCQVAPAAIARRAASWSEGCQCLHAKPQTSTQTLPAPATAQRPAEGNEVRQAHRLHHAHVAVLVCSLAWVLPVLQLAVLIRMAIEARGAAERVAVAGWRLQSVTAVDMYACHPDRSHAWARRMPAASPKGAAAVSKVEVAAVHGRQLGFVAWLKHTCDAKFE